MQATRRSSKDRFVYWTVRYSVVLQLSTRTQRRDDWGITRQPAVSIIAMLPIECLIDDLKNDSTVALCTQVRTPLVETRREVSVWLHKRCHAHPTQGPLASFLQSQRPVTTSSPLRAPPFRAWPTYSWFCVDFVSTHRDIEGLTSAGPDHEAQLCGNTPQMTACLACPDIFLFGDRP